MTTRQHRLSSGSNSSLAASAPPLCQRHLRTRKSPSPGFGETPQLRNPVKVITHSTLNVIADSTVSDQLSERSDAGVGFMSRGDQFG